MKKWFYLILFFPVVVACQKDLKDDRKPMEVNVSFRPVSGNEPLEFGKTYINALGEDLTVTTFKFYLHNIRIGNYTLGNEDHYLADFNASPVFTVSGVVPESRYTEMSFIIGVDSVRNFSGAQTGALDPLHGMFWTWNSGYIMAKLEGHSSFASTLGNMVEYHIGGFSGEQNVIKKITLPLPAYTPQPGQPLSITVNADIMKWFGGESNISIAENPVCMTPGELAVKIAGNYYNMFSIETE